MGVLGQEMNQGYVMTSVFKRMPAQCPPVQECGMDTKSTVITTVACMVIIWGIIKIALILHRGLCNQKEVIDKPLHEDKVRTVACVPVNVRDVNTQIMCTYNRRVQNPYFLYIVPQGKDGVWISQGAWLQPAKLSRKVKGR